MIDQIRFNAEIPREHVGDEPLGKGRLVSEQAKHRRLVDDEHRRRCGRGGRSDANRLTGERPLAEEIAGAEHRDNSFLSGP
jgi:hypothetical protein